MRQSSTGECFEKGMPGERHENEKPPQDYKTKEMSGQEVPQGKAISTERGFKEKTCVKTEEYKKTRKMVSRENVKRRSQEKNMPKAGDAKHKRHQRKAPEKPSV